MSNIISDQQAIDYLSAAEVDPASPVVVLGLRAPVSGYGKYDDVISIVGAGTHVEYLGNTLPSIDRRGVAVLQPGVYNYEIGLHGISHLRVDAEGRLVPGDQNVYNWLELHMRQGMDYPYTVLDGQGHTRLLPYPALRQAGPVTVKRIGSMLSTVDGWPTNPDWIDIHKGGYNLTSSLGCQTLHPDHWDQFRKDVFGLIVGHSLIKIKYVLVQR